MQMDKEKAEDFFSILYRGKHHLPSKVKPFGEGWSILYYGDIATYDFNFLTRLVFLAHDKCIRASVMQGGPGRIKIALHQRGGREGNMYNRHPTIESALEKWRLK